MRSAFLATFLLLALPACQALEDLPTQSTALPRPTVSLTSTLVQRDLVRLIWSVRDGEGRRFEILRQNRAEPWKHFATLEPLEGMIRIDDTGVVPGQRYVYRLRLFGTTDGTFLDEVQVAVPL